MGRINKNLLKAIILENIEFIESTKGNIIKRELDVPISAENKVIIFYGLRRAGKTFILFQMAIDNEREYLYVDFDDDRLEGFTIEDFETLKECYYELFPDNIDQEVYYLLDEIQRIEGWEKFCRRMAKQPRVQVVVAGSSTDIYPQNIHTSLRGRSLSFEIFPYSFKEFLNQRDIEVSPKAILSNQKYNIIKAFEEYLYWGGFPEVISAQNQSIRQNIVNEYLDALYFKDLVERHEIKNTILLEALKNKIYASFSTQFSLNAFYKQLKGNIPISKDMLYEYYNHMVDSKLIYQVEMFSDSEYKKIRNPKKVYIADLTFARKTSHDDSARKLENFVFMELRRTTNKINYIHTDNSECDFVIQINNQKRIFQVTHEITENNRDREINGLIKSAKYLNLDQGTIITHNEESSFVEGDIKIEVFPAWKWALSL